MKAFIFIVLLAALAIYANAKKPKIIKAYYWTKDVTHKVRHMVHNGQLNIQATNSIFGDPKPGTEKSLVIAYQYHGEEPQLKAVLEGDTLHLTAGVNAVQFIISQHTKIYGAFYANKDVGYKVALLAIANNGHVDAENSNFGDPLPGHLKTLAVLYKHKHKPIKLKIIPEHQDMTVPL